MHFIIYCIDKPGSADLRTNIRSDHITFLEKHRNNIFIAGPILTEDSKDMIGSLLIVDFPSIKAANNFASNDPYFNAGLFESVSIKPWKMVFEPTN